MGFGKFFKKFRKALNPFKHIQQGMKILGIGRKGRRRRGAPPPPPPELSPEERQFVGSRFGGQPGPQYSPYGQEYPTQGFQPGYSSPENPWQRSPGVVPAGQFPPQPYPAPFPQPPYGPNWRPEAPAAGPTYQPVQYGQPQAPQMSYFPTPTYREPQPQPEFSGGGYMPNPEFQGFGGPAGEAVPAEFAPPPSANPMDPELIKEIETVSALSTDATPEP